MTEVLTWPKLSASPTVSAGVSSCYGSKKNVHHITVSWRSASAPHHLWQAHTHHHLPRQSTSSARAVLADPSQWWYTTYRPPWQGLQLTSAERSLRCRCRLFVYANKRELRKHTVFTPTLAMLLQGTTTFHKPACGKAAVPAVLHCTVLYFHTVTTHCSQCCWQCCKRLLGTRIFFHLITISFPKL